MQESGRGVQIAAIVAVVLGVILVGVGIAGATADWGSSTKSAAATPQPTTTVPAASSPTTVAPLGQTPLQFVTALASAMRAHDTSYLVAHLHPAVLARYGAAQCARYVGTIDDPIVAKSISRYLAPYAYTSDGKTTVVPGVTTVNVTIDGKPATVHTVLVDGTWRWFTDCGTATG